MKWNVEKRKIKDLHEYAKTPRYLHKVEAEHLQESIDKFGQCEPIVINRDGIIVGGHQRVRTMRKMGYKEVDVYVPDLPLSEKEIEELNMRLNKNIGNWDYDMLANAWDPEDLLEWGFTEKDLHMDAKEEEEEMAQEEPPSKSSKMTIHFKDKAHLEEAEDRIGLIIDEYEGAFYKIK